MCAFLFSCDNQKRLRKSGDVFNNAVYHVLCVAV